MAVFKELEIKRNPETKPSLPREIVDEVDMLDDEGKMEILRNIRMQKALSMAKVLDEKLNGNTLMFSEEEIADIVSKDRKDRYEKKTGA
ncbi:MAG: hypothetical protein LH478_10625 [Chitinophagaceae bacterium]|nr:hypothetical protein [Chitinophagaceae bacterium]